MLALITAQKTSRFKNNKMIGVLFLGNKNHSILMYTQLDRNPVCFNF